MTRASVESVDGRVVAHPGLVSRRIGSETILIPVSSRVGDLDAVYTLTEVAARVWTLLQQPVAVAEIVATLCAEYDVSPAAATADVRELIASLSERRLVDAAQAGGA